MKFMITGAEPRGEWQRLDAEEMSRRVRVHVSRLEELAAARVGAGASGLIFASIGLGLEHDVITVKHEEEGRHVTTDGPFPETKEVIGGFDIVDFAAPRDAVAWAAGTKRHASHVAEIRPIAEFWWLSGVVDRVRLMQFERLPGTPSERTAAAQVFLLTTVNDARLTATLRESDSRRAQRRLPAEYINARGTVSHEGGMWLGARLGPRAQASTVRWSSGEPVVSDAAPALPTEIVGFNMIACASRDEAVGWARKLAAHAGQSIEIRSVRGCWWYYRE